MVDAQRLKPYLTSRHQDIDEWNKQLDAPESALNHRRMPNIGTLRPFMKRSLPHPPHSRKHMTPMLLQHAP